MLLTNSTVFCFRLDSLAILEKCVRRLASDGGIFERDSTTLWSDALPVDDDLSSSEAIESSLERTMIRVDEIQILKSLSNGLDRLRESLDKFIEARCEEILPATRHHGLASLPDDILQAIFEQLLESYEDPFLGSRDIICDLSLVSQRFRENALAFAKAWTYVDANACDTESFPLFLERSKNRLLNVQFVFFEGMKEGVLSVLRFGDCWKPAVKRLEVWGHPSSSGSIPWTSPGWSFPNVEQIHIHGDLPNPESFSYKSLKSLTYTSRRFDSFETCFDGVFLTRFANFLRPAVSLHALYLDLSFFRGWSAHDAEFPNEVELPNVKTFSISNEATYHEPYYYRNGDGYLMVTNNFFPLIIDTIKLPNVEDLHVAYNFETRTFVDNLEEGLLEMFSPHFGSATSLSFKILRWSDTLHVDKFFEHFPNLRRLALDTSNSDCRLTFTEEYRSRENLEKLDSVQIKLNDQRMQVYDTFCSMAEAKASPKEVVIHSAYTFDEGELENIFPGAKVQTITY